MDIEQLRDYCMSKPGSEECFPFDNDTLVYKVNGKVFLLASLDASPLQFNVKCDPERALELKERFTSIQPGYHMNKKYWNTIIIEGTLTAEQLRELIDHSYELVSRAKKK
jgi:predicted DNA-binding protein (MmcQ/YjbR family)